MDNEHEEHNKLAEQRIIDDVEKYGCHLALLEADNYLPGFAYSIGLYKNYNHAEIICFGLPTEVLGAVLNDAKTRIQNGEKLETLKLYEDFLEGYKVQFLEVAKEHFRDYLGYAKWFSGGWNFPAIQLVWPDKEHFFPWEEGFNAKWQFKQPLLDRNTDFKFYEPRNLGVYTTKHVLEGKPIRYVYHNNDGDWQFHSEDDPKTEDAKLVCLEEITKKDPSINEIYYLQYGWKAYREDKESKWEIDENE
jgi:hypothetical protein